MKKIYIVKYGFGGYDDYTEVIIFATINEATAKKYVQRFNRILKKWKEHYAQYENGERGFRWLKDEYAETHFERWNMLREIKGCFYHQVELR
jgi:hypothetical protein